MSNYKSHLSAGIAALALVLPATALAQNSTTGAIQGVVSDKATGEGLAGVTVVVTSPALQGTQSAITDGQGTYKITTLPPGTYSGTFYYSDITVRRNNIQVRLNRTTPAYVKMNTSQAGGEVIVINDKAPTIDPTSTNQGITLDSDYTKNIPIPGRTFEAALGAAAGSSGDALGVSFSGSTSLENSYIIDGVNTTGLTFGTIGSALITDFIEEIEIITGGYNAEYGRSTGAVVNVVTKSGSNEFKGSVFSYYTPGFLRASARRNPTQASSIDAVSNLAYAMDFGFDLGGPIIKDKVWFYVGFAPALSRVNITRTIKRRTDCRETGMDGELSNCDPRLPSQGGFADGFPDEDPDTGFLIYEDIESRELNAQQTSYQFVSKVNFAVAPEHQGQISLIGTPLSGESAGVRGLPSATSFDYTQLTTDLAMKWTSKFNNNKTEIEAVLGWHRRTTELDSIDNTMNDVVRQNLYYGNLGTWSGFGYEGEATRRECTDGGAVDTYPLIDNCPDLGLGYRIGGPGSIRNDKEERFSAKVTATQRIKGVGNHEVKVGLDVEDNRIHDLRQISGGTFYDVYLSPFNQTYSIRWVRLAPDNMNNAEFDRTCRDDTDPTDVKDFACSFIDSDNVVGNTFNWSAFARDSWQPIPSLTLNYGLRYEEQRMRYAKELQNTGDPFTGNTRGKNAMVIKSMWAPRIGALYDWTKEGRSKVYGHWGRFYESIPMNLNTRSFGGETLYQRGWDSTTQCGGSDPDIGGPTGPGCEDPANNMGQNPANGETVFGAGTLVAPGIKGQFLDEYIVGVEYEVLEDLKLGISYQDRRLGRILEDVSVDQADTYILANPGEIPQSELDNLASEIAALAGSCDETDPDLDCTKTLAALRNNLEQFEDIRIFDKPRRDYQAIQITATRRFSRNFFAQGSYTYSRTKGNFPGLFSADNGQVDPNISSQFDLIELLANRDGPLPQDRPHYFKLDAYYKLELDRYGLKQGGDITGGIRFRALSGTPKSALGRHYLYGFNESFVLPRGAMGRSDFDFGVDIHLGYERQISKGMRFEISTDLYSIFNTQGTFSTDQMFTPDRANPVVGGTYEDLVFLKAQTTRGGETSDPVRTNRNFGNTFQRYSPFSARLVARLTF